MIEPVSIPIILDIDLSLDEYELEVESPIVIGGGTGHGLPLGGVYGDLLAKRSDTNYDAEWITPASSVEKDNTRPITAAAVYTEIGNINALLATI